MFSNELKFFVISDMSQKYDEINKNLLKITNLYYFLIKNYSSKLAQIEKLFNDINIKQLLENQNHLIRELVKIINNLLIEKINTEMIRKYEEESIETVDESFNQKSKNIITNKNLDMFAKQNKNYSKKAKKSKVNNNINNSKIENNNLISKKINNQKEIIPLNIISPKTYREYNGTLSFFNININNNSNIKTYEPHPKKAKNKLSSKSCNNLKMMHNNILSKNNNFNNIYCNMNNTYTIDEEGNDDYNSGNNEDKNSVNNNYDNENYSMLEMSDNKKQKREYTHGNNSEIDYKRNFHKIPIKSEIYFKSFPNILKDSFNNDKEDFSYKKRCHTTENFFKSNLYNLNRNNLFRKFSKKEIYSVPYFYNGKINSPSKLTKKIYNSSYKKLSNYTKKRHYTSS